MLTKKDIKAFVRETVSTMKKEVDNHNDWVERANEEVDAWWGSHIGTGRIDQMGNIESDRDIRRLIDMTKIFELSVEEGWGVESDSGLWEGLAPFGAIAAQAYHTLSGAIMQKEPRDLV